MLLRPQLSRTTRVGKRRGMQSFDAEAEQLGQSTAVCLVCVRRAAPAGGADFTLRGVAKTDAADGMQICHFCSARRTTLMGKRSERTPAPSSNFTTVKFSATALLLRRPGRLTAQTPSSDRVGGFVVRAKYSIETVCTA